MRFPDLLYPLIFFFLCPTSIFAQVDSNYIQLFDNRSRLNTGLKYREREVSFSTSAGENFILQNRGLDYRIGGRYKWLGYTFSLPLSDLGTGNDTEEGKSFGLGLRLYRPRLYFRTRFRKTEGFRNIDPQETGRFRKDVQLFTATIFGYYVLDHRVFSLRSSFKQNDRQLKSNGSLLVGGLINRQVLNADSIRIPLRSDQLISITRFAQTKLGLGGGYAYTWVITKRFYITPVLIAGPEFRFINYQVEEGRERERLRISPRIRGHLAIGINGERYFGALTAAYLPSLDVTDNLNTRIDHLEVELRLGRRF